jgi:hypothetical protein
MGRPLWMSTRGSGYTHKEEQQAGSDDGSIAFWSGRGREGGSGNEMGYWLRR